MGQSVSSPKPHPDLADFLNFPKEALDSLWTSYNLLGEGWGLNLGEMMAIFKGADFVASNYAFTDEQLTSLFNAFDTDRNGLIDALELFVTIALTSGMDTIDKIYFAFSAYDFDNAGSLSFDEATLLLRSVVQGLGKVSPSNVIFTSPTFTEIEKFTSLVFQHSNKESNGRSASRITTVEFKNYCSFHPVTSSWLKTAAQFRAESAPKDSLTVPLGNASVLLGACANQEARAARKPQQMASIISEEDFLVISEFKAAEAAEASKPKHKDIIKGDDGGDEEDEESQEARRAAEAAAAAAAAANDPNAPVLPSWAVTVDLMKPEDAPSDGRNDPPEDLFEPIWLTGVNTTRLGGSDLAPPLMHRSVKYANMTLPPVPEALPEGEEAPPVVISTVLLGSAASQLFVMKKDEETGWNQRLFNQHGSAITCLDVHYPKNLLVTAENNGADSRVVIWGLDTFAVLKTIATGHGVKLLDISESGTLLLVVTTDLAATCTMYDIATGKVVFARPLLLGPRTVKDTITDIRFTGTSAMFAVSSAQQGVTFYVEEGGSFMGPDGLKLYEERGGLYQAIGRPAVGAAVTELCRFEGTDELVAGTDKGQLLVWHGRTVAQLIEAHRTPVNALDFNKLSLTLISGGADGTINIYTLAGHAPAAAQKAKKTPQLFVPRMLELSATFDILRHDLCSYSIRSLSLSADSRRALVTTSACEMMELALFITPPTAEEIAEAEAAQEAAAAARAEAQAAAQAAREAAIAAGEPVPDEASEESKGEDVAGANGIPSLQRFLGDDVHKAPILTAHYATEVGAAASVTALCKVPLGGFASCGSDGTVRWWQGAGGNEETGATVYKTTKVIKMDSGCSALDASPSTIAVALTSIPSAQRDGSIHLFSLPEMQFITQFSESKKTISTMKFSPEGNLLVAASTDGALYVYQAVEGQWTYKGVCGAASDDAAAFPSKIDFSADGLYVRAYYHGTGSFRLYDVGTPAFGKDLVDLSAIPAPPAKRAAPVDGDDEAPPAEDAGPTGPPLDLLRGLTWASNACGYNWDTKGAISLQLPGANDRFNHLLLTATAEGGIAVERVPAVKYAAKKADLDTGKLVTFKAHLGGVSALAFIEEGLRLVSAGAADGTLRVWKVTYDMDEFEPDPAVAEEAAAGIEEAEEGEEDEAGKAKKLEVIYDSGEDDDLLDSIRMKEHLSRDNNKKRITMQEQQVVAAQLAEAAAVAAALAAAEANLAETDSQSGSAAGGAGPAPEDSRPPPDIDLEVNLHSGVAKWGAHLGLNKRNMASECARALSAPPSLVPTDELELNWVYGCSSRHTRGAVHYSREGTVIYPAGCLGVIYEKNGNTQAFAMPHSDEITALDVHVTSGLAVSAHKGNGVISACIWNTADGSIRRYLDCGVVNGVSAIKFSPDASHVVLTCQDKDHTVLLFSVADGRLRASYRNGPKKPLCLSFSLAETNVAGTAPIRILQGGVQHFKFLTFHPARSTLYGKTGGYGADVKKSNVNCVGALPLQPGADGGEPTGNEFLLGMADGTIGVVAKGESKVSAFTPVMKGAVTALYVVKLKDGNADEPPAYKVVVGGINGSLKVLDQELQPISEWNLYLNEYGLLPLGRVRGFKSLCVDKLNRKILYATAGGEVGELDLQMGVDVNKGPLVHGHFRDQLHALCAHPLRQECITAGDDKTLRVWLLDQRKMATSIDLPDIARAATYSPNGHLIVAGLGGEVPGNGRTPRPMRGKVVVISYLQGALRLVHTAGDAKDTITAVLFTPDGSKLLASSLDGNVYIYDALNNFQLLMSLGGQHKEGVRSMDISESGQYVTTHGEYNEFFVWDLSTAAVVKTNDRFEALAVTGLNWSVRQGPFGLNSVGVFPAFSDPADTLTLNQSKDHKLLVVGDSFGALKLFRNPATEYFAPYKKYTCHSPGGISKLAFTVKDQFLLSTGRFDRVLAQWKVLKSSDLPDNKISAEEAPEPVAPEEDYDATYVIKGVNFVDEGLVRDYSESAEVKVQLSAIVGTGTATSTLPRAQFFGQGDLLTAHGKLPVLVDVGGSGAQRVLFAPAGGASPYNNSAQQQVSAFAVAPSGQFAAIGHTTANTADNAGACRLVMVGAPSGLQVSELSADIPGGVTAVAFSEDGVICACLSGDAQHTLHVFRTYSGTWEDATLVSTAQVSAANINLLSFIAAPASAAAIAASLVPAAASEALPMQTEADTDPVAPAAPTPAAAAAASPVVTYDLVTAGAGHIKFWRIQGQNLYCTCGDYGADAMNRAAFTALASCGGGAYFRAQVITGDGEGNLHYWRSGKKILKTAAHHSAITALKSFGTLAAVPAAGTRRIVTSTTGSEVAPVGFVSGSNDKLVIWSTDTDVATVTHTFSVPQLLSACGWSSSIYLSDKLAARNYITSIDNDPRCQRLVVCFSSSPVITITKDSRTVQKVTEGHDRSARVTAVVAHPSDADTVVTLAEDGMVRVWDIANNTVVGAGGESAASAASLVGTLQLQHTPTAATFLNPNTVLVAISGADTNGTSGSILVVSFQPNVSFSGIDCKYNLAILSRMHNVGTGALCQLKVSPQCKYLAASCSDGCVYVFRLDGVDAAGNLARSSESSAESKSGDLAESVFIPMGFLLAHPTGAPVVGVDFSTDARYARTFGENFAKINGKVEMNFFDFSKTDGGDEGHRVHAAVKIQDPALLEEMRVASWASVSSPAAVEARGVNYVVGEGRLGPKTVQLAPSQAWAVSASGAASAAPLLCTTYEDGSVGVYRYPVYSAIASRDARAVVDVSVHSQGKVVCAFTSGQRQRLVTVGQQDGSIFVWDLQA